MNADDNGTVVMSASENNDGDGSPNNGSNEHRENSLP